MVARRTDYTADAVKAARSVLLELTHLLGEYRDDIVVVGGWVPELLLGPHVGTMDVDLALNHPALQEQGYKTIRELLRSHGYHEASQPFIFFRTVRNGGQEFRVEVDLLAGEYAGTGKSHRTQQMLDVRGRKARGCDLAFEMSSEVMIQGILPDGAEDSAIVRVASIVPYLVMKGMALYDRMKEKDAWDVYYCLCHYPGGLDGLAQEFLPHMGHGLVREGLLKIAEKFASPNHVGPSWVVDFDGLTEPEARAITQRDAHEHVSELLNKLGLP